jgi:hypothetical protein
VGDNGPSSVSAPSLVGTIIEYARRYAGTVLFAIPLGFVISWGTNKFWAGSQLIVFVAVVICWLSGAIQVIVRDVRQGDESIHPVFSDPRNWNSADLPIDFRSITHAMTLGQLVGRVGPYMRVTETGLSDTIYRLEASSPCSPNDLSTKRVA